MTSQTSRAVLLQFNSNATSTNVLWNGSGIVAHTHVTRVRWASGQRGRTTWSPSWKCDVTCVCVFCPFCLL